MAGIGFALRRLTRRDDYLGLLQAYGHSALITSGPWLFTIASLATVNLLSASRVPSGTLDLFRTVLIYNFCFSLVLCGPIVLVATRTLADMIYARSLVGGPSLLIGSLWLAFGAGLLVTIPFYGLAVDMTPAVRVAAIANFLVIAGVWIVAVFLTALKDYHAITFTFAVGMLVAFPSCLLLAPSLGAAGMLWGFGAGMAIILFTLIARVFAEYPYDVRAPWAVLAQFRRYRELALLGLLANAAAWSDKWVMWFAPEHNLIAGAMRYYQHYDAAMFFAYLAMIPALAIFNVSVETTFFERYQAFYGDIQRHATLARIRRNHARLTDALFGGSRNLVVLQAAICAVGVFAAPRIVEAIGADFRQIGMLRFGLLGVLFHMLVIYVSTMLAYFDLRRLNIAYQTFFLVTNTGFTLLALEAGFPYYGYGYFVAALLTAVVGFAGLAIVLRRLPYITFVTNNSSLR